MTRAHRRPGLKLLAGVIFSVLMASSAGATEPRLWSSGASIRSAEPPALVTVPASAKYLGSRRWLLYGYADCDLHLYVETDSRGEVNSLYWIQSEAYIPDRPELTHARDYLDSRKLELGGLAFHLDTWTRKRGETAPAGSDLEQVEQLIAAGKLRLPAEMSFVRLVHLPDEAKRKELMIIYGERLDRSTGRGSDQGSIARMKQAIAVRAQGSATGR